VVKISVEIACRPCPGEQVSGDEVVLREEGELRLWAVIDALGHGVGAAETAAVAAAYLYKAPLGLDLAPVVEGLHRALKNTRGGVALLVGILGEQLVGCGVGNISIRSSRSAFSVISVPGVLGLRRPNPRVFRASIGAGDRLAIFSDGISGRFSWDELRGLSTKEAASLILTNYGRSHDDATVVFADVTG
jgi:negative regulator of sigma-B (phosphoserine phosphatase)